MCCASQKNLLSAPKIMGQISVRDFIALFKRMFLMLPLEQQLESASVVQQHSILSKLSLPKNVIIVWKEKKEDIKDANCFPFISPCNH